MYGTLDVGVQYLTHAGTDGKARFGMQSGNAIPSHFGIRGTEDIGDGRQIYFDLENGFTVNDGKIADSSTFFNRYAYVGYRDPQWGSLEMGREWNLMFQTLLEFDATEMAQYSLLSTSLFPAQTDWPGNSIKYISPAWHGFTGYAEYSFGQQLAGVARAGRYIGLALAYDAGPLAARAVYEDSRGELDAATGIDASGKVERRVTMAAKYRFGAATAMGGFANISGDLGLSPDGDLMWAGATFQVSSRVKLIAQAMHEQLFRERGQPTWVVLGSTLSLSPRTFVYGYAGVLDNHGASTVSLNALDATEPYGMSQTGVQVGINHSF
nr:porin [Burkholderia sp. Ac-20379]